MLGGVRARREQGWTLGSWRGTVVSPSRGLGLPDGPQGLSRVEGEGQRWEGGLWAWQAVRRSGGATWMAVLLALRMGTPARYIQMRAQGPGL